MTAAPRARSRRRAALASIAFVLTVGAMLAVPAQAGFRILFFVFCPPDGFTQQDTVKVKIPAKATGYEAQLESPPGTPLGSGEPVCPGTTMTQDVTRSDSQDPRKDVITNVITSDNSGGGGSEQEVQALFRAQAHVDVGVTKVAYVSGQGEVDTIREGKRFTWLVTITNHSKLPIKKGKLKLTEVLPKGFKYDGTNVDQNPDAVKVEPPADGHGPTFTYRLDRDIDPNSGLVVSIFGEQRLPDDLEEQVVQNHATVTNRNPAQTEPTPDPHPNDVYAPLTVRARNH